LQSVSCDYKDLIADLVSSIQSIFSWNLDYLATLTPMPNHFPCHKFSSNLSFLTDFPFFHPFDCSHCDCTSSESSNCDDFGMPFASITPSAFPGNIASFSKSPVFMP